MSVDSPEPRQRTVAELLAENSGSQTGRRRRRRAADDEPVEAGHGGGAGDPGRSGAPTRRPEPSAGGEPYGYAAPPARDGVNGAPRPAGNGYEPNGYDRGGYEPNGHDRGGYEPNGYDRGGYEPNGHDRGGYEPNGHDRGGYEPNGHGPDGYGSRGGYEAGGTDAFRAPAPRGAPAGGPQRPEPYPDRPAPTPPPQALAPPAAPRRAAPGPLPQVPGGPPTRGDGRAEQGERFPDDADAPTGAFNARTPGGAVSDAGPPTRFGAPPLDDDGGPPTQLGGPPLRDDDVDEGAGTGYEDGDTGPHAHRAPAPPDGGPPTQAGFGPADIDDLDADQGHAEPVTALQDADEPEEAPRRRRGLLGRRAAPAEAGEPGPDAEQDPEPSERAAGTGQAWAMVIAQWIGGAVVGAVVWVGFRYLWFSLPVVALALAVALTIGLVLGVRALLRNDDLKTTMFAVLVGLLLTVSPAILVLLDR